MSNIYQTYTPPAGNGGLFLKVNDGDVVRLRVLGDPVVFENEYEGKLSTRYAWPVYNHDEGKLQVFQGGATIFNEIASIATDEDWGDITETDIKVGRKGQGTDTKYSVQPAPKAQPVPEDLEELDLVAIISKSEFSRNVQTIEDRMNGAKPTNNKPGQDNLPNDEDIDDKPIDLDEIPF